MSNSDRGRQDQQYQAPQAQETTDFNDRAGGFLQVPQAPPQYAQYAAPSGQRQDQAVNEVATVVPQSQQQWQEQIDPQLSQGPSGWQQQQFQERAPVAYPNPVDVLQQPGNAEFYQQEPAGEDFLLMDVVGGGCANQSGRFASRSVAVLHPTKPVVAYSAGCMIIVYDLMSDSKVNLVGHQHDVHALCFTPGGESLISVDFNRNAELQDNLNAQGGLSQEPTSQVFLWDWQRGSCLQEAAIPRSQNLSMILTAGGAGGAPQIHNQEQPGGIFSQAPGFSLSSFNEQAEAPSTCNIRVSVEKSGTMFMVLESSPLEIGGGYRVTLWSFNKQQVMEMISSMDLELQCPCIDLSFLPRTQSDILSAQRSAGQTNHSAQVFLNSRLPFLTIEKQCIKLWEYSQGNAQLKKRIHIKQNIASMEISELTNFFLILGESGKVLILDQQGEFVSTVSKEGVVFTKIGAAHDKLLLGTNRGTLHVYHMASLQFISEVPYQLSFLEKFSLNSFAQTAAEMEQLSLQKVGPPVSAMGSTQNLRFLWIRYQDGSFVVIDRTIMNPRQAILGYSCGHFEAISGMQWVPPRSSIDLVSRPGGFSNLNNQSAFGQLGPDGAFPGQGGAQATHDQQFVTCSHDLSIHLWRHYGDRWAFSYIDVAKSFDQALSFQRKQCDRSTRDLKLTALCLYPRSNNLVVGDSKGFVRVFQLVNENAHLIATYRLPRSQEVRAERAFGINENPLAARLGVGGIDEEFSNDQIKEIYITKNEATAVITFQSGMISFYDTKNGYTWIGDAVDQGVSKFNTQQASGNFLAIQTKVLEVGDRDALGSLGTSFKDRMQMYHQKMPLQQDERPTFSQSGSPMSDLSRGRGGGFPRSMHGSNAASLKILSLQTPNQVAMQLVDVKGTKLTRSPLCQYVISEGKVTGFDLHPSGDYLLATSSKGRVYVFRIDTGELRGTIRVPLNASGCQIDPSGLYVIVKVPAFANINAMNLASGGGAAELANQIGHFGANERDLARNTVMMFGIGTGEPAAEICSVFEISEMRFACDGRFLALGSTSGAISVWSMGSHLHQNVKQVLDAMKLSNDFWFNYPIFLPDSELNQGTGELPPQMLPFRGPADDAQQFPEWSGQYPAAEVPQSQSQYQQDATNSQRQYAQQVAQPHQAPQEQFQQQAFDGQQDFGYQQPQPLSAYRPQSMAGNEQRFMRKSFAPADRGEQDQIVMQRREQERIAFQRGMNSGLYGSNVAQRPQSGQVPMNNYEFAQGIEGNTLRQAHYPTPTRSPQMGPVHYPECYHTGQCIKHNREFIKQCKNCRIMVCDMCPQQLDVDGTVNTCSNPQCEVILIQKHRERFQQQQPSPGGGWPQQDQGRRGPPNQAYQGLRQVQNAQIPHYPPTDTAWAQDGTGNRSMRVSLNQAPNANDLAQGQARAAATLLGGGLRESARNVDLGEPVPFNQSQLLYGGAVNANIGGADTMTKGNFERFADFGQGGAYQVNRPNINDANVQRNVYDQSLNERAAMTAASAQPFAANGVGMSEAFPQGQQQQYQPEGNWDVARPPSAPRDAGNPAPRSRPVSGTSAGPNMGTGDWPDSKAPVIGAERKQDVVDTSQEFKPAGFTNTMTQQDILQGVPGLKPDPVDIDGGLREPIKASPSRSQSPKPAKDMVRELEGMSRYMQGVTMPGALGVAPPQSFTLKNQRQDEAQAWVNARKPISNLSQLYSGAPSGVANQPAPMRNPGGAWRPTGPGSASADQSVVKSSTRDVVDEMYQSIDDFEQKLQVKRFVR